MYCIFCALEYFEYLRDHSSCAGQGWLIHVLYVRMSREKSLKCS